TDVSASTQWSLSLRCSARGIRVASCTHTTPSVLATVTLPFGPQSSEPTSSSLTGALRAERRSAERFALGTSSTVHRLTQSAVDASRWSASGGRSAGRREDQLARHPVSDPGLPVRDGAEVSHALGRPVDVPAEDGTSHQRFDEPARKAIDGHHVGDVPPQVLDGAQR